MHHMQKETRQKHSVSAGFVAGAEGLEPSARGFGVDVETAHRERGRDKVAPFYQPSHKTGGAGLVLREILGAKTSEKERKIPGKAGNTLA